ncbi:MAG: DUF5916 domain-containing protein [Vicinamibacterales bacterium]
MSGRLVFVWRLALVVCACHLASSARAQTTQTPASPSPATPLSSLPRPERVRRLRGREWDITATRARGPMVVDGALTEGDWELATPISEFYQGQRNEGLPASERTEVRVLFDERNLYVGFRAWDSEPDRIKIRSLFRDESGGADDLVSVMLDAYHGHRSAIQFVTNANGLQEDLLQTGEATSTRNHDWDTVWMSRGRRLDDGFEVEIAIPFKSLRFEPPDDASEVTFGIGFKRNIPRRNEESTWPFVPNDSTWYRPAELGHLHGLTSVRPGRNLEIRPYALGGHTENYGDGPPDRTRREAGLDAKWGVTTGITADFTFNTDFAQEEVDVQQVNLTRFSLFFPEKRQFFLEGQQAFRFGVPQEADLIFTRRIGLSPEGQPLRLWGGARVSGRQGRTTLGAMNLQVDDTATTPSQNYTVARVKQDILARSSIGAMFSNVEGGGRFNRVAGADASFYVNRVWFFDVWGAHVSRSEGGRGSNGGYTRAAYQADRYAASYQFLGIGQSFAPGVGFVRRPNSLQHEASARFSPRPGNSLVRQYHFEGTLLYITDTRTIPDTRERTFSGRAEFESGDAAEVEVNNIMENLKRPFTVRNGVTLTPGTYRWTETAATFDSFRRRHLQLDATYTTGGFYGGSRDAVSMALTWRPNPLVGLTSNYAVNWVDLPQGQFTTQLVSSRLQLAFRKNLALLSLLQMNTDSHQVSTNLRFNWIPKDGTDFFIVYNETDGTLDRWTPRNRALTVKFNYLIPL